MIENYRLRRFSALTSLALAPFVSTVQAADVWGVSRSAFEAAVLSQQMSGQNFDGFSSGSILISDGNVTYAASAGLPLITSRYLTTSFPNGLGRTRVGFFQSADSITFSFSSPVRSFGLDINSFGAFAGDYIAVTNTGSTVRSLNEVFPNQATGQYLGFVSSVPFTQVKVSADQFSISPNLSFTVDSLAFGQSTASNHALFVGVRDGPSSMNLRGDLAAIRLANDFNSLPNSSARAATADLLATDGFSAVRLEEEIRSAARAVLPGDSLTLYFTGHGSSDLGFGGFGDEYVNLGFKMTDDWLSKILNDFPDINKAVIIDACSAGGFWGPPADALEDLFGSGYDLDNVSKTAMLASSSELGLAYYGDDGIPLVATALSFGLQLGMDGYMGADTNRNGLITFEEIVSYVTNFAYLVEYDGEVVYQLDTGNGVIFSPEFLSISSKQTADFSGVQIYAPIPEPKSIVLFALGLLLILKLKAVPRVGNRDRERV